MARARDEKERGAGGSPEAGEGRLSSVTPAPRRGGRASALEEVGDIEVLLGVEGDGVGSRPEDLVFVVEDRLDRHAVASRLGDRGRQGRWLLEQAADPAVRVHSLPELVEPGGDDRDAD